VGASCVYPESQNLLVGEDYFTAGWVQKATEPYALAKAVGTKLCSYYSQQYGASFVTAALSNIYGWSDSRHYDKSSVVPAMIEKFNNAVQEGKSEVSIWGTGENKREFLYVKDCAKALVTIMNSDITGIVNVGSGEMVTINELAQTVSEIVGYNGKIEHDLSRPEGSKRSVLDISRLRELGWTPQYSLKQGLAEMIRYKERV
jgi:GDP-L-fucose synthase